MIDYVLTISRAYPGLEVSCAGDNSVYQNLIAENGSVLPAEADLIIAANELVLDDAWIAIKALRDLRKAGGVKVGAYWFHSDDASRIQQLALVMMGAGIPANLQWKTMSGQFVTMTQSLAGQIFQTIAGSDQRIFAKAESHHAAVLASTDPANYNFSIGWPITYTESPEYVA